MTFFVLVLTTVRAILFQRCTSFNITHKPQIPKRTCVTHLKSDNHYNHGYVMVSSCPVYNTDKNLESLCAARSSETDLFGMLPVSDLKNKTAYKNEFCARCNQAANLTNWKLSASCEGLGYRDIQQTDRWCWRLYWRNVNGISSHPVLRVTTHSYA